ncbi:MAG: hypothetical protein WA666_06725 [Nitrospirota bacterium]
MLPNFSMPSGFRREEIYTFLGGLFVSCSYLSIFSQYLNDTNRIFIAIIIWLLASTVIFILIDFYIKVLIYPLMKKWDNEKARKDFLMKTFPNQNSKLYYFDLESLKEIQLIIHMYNVSFMTILLISPIVIYIAKFSVKNVILLLISELVLLRFLFKKGFQYSLGHYLIGELKKDFKIDFYDPKQYAAERSKHLALDNYNYHKDVKAIADVVLDNLNSVKKYQDELKKGSESGQLNDE